MIFNPFAFLIGRTIALNRGVASGTASTDGFVAGVVRPPVLGIVLVSAIAGNQAASAPSTTAAPSIIGLSPSIGPEKNPVIISGTNFGSQLDKITVTFGGKRAPIKAFDPVKVTIGTEVPANLSILGFNVDVDVVVTVNGAASAAATFTATPTP